MKPLLVLARITFVGCLWSIIFIEGIRVIVLENWRFDIFWPPHWAYAWNLWQSGWVIDTKKEWAFILILITFIPLWLMGWIALSLVPWESILYRIISFPFKLFKKSVQPIAQVVSGTPVITKKKSYKEIRPTGKRVPIYDYTSTPAPTPAPIPAITQSAPQNALPAPSSPTKDRAVSARETLNHTIFDLDDEDNDFDLDIDSFDKADIFKIDSNKNKKSTSSVFEEDAYEHPRRTKPKQQFKSYDLDDDDEQIQEDEEDYSPRYRRAKQAPQNTKYNMDDEEDDDLEDYEPAYRSAKTPHHAQPRFEDDFNDTPKPSRRFKGENRDRSMRTEKPLKSDSGAIADILHEKGYHVIRNVSVGSGTADYLALSADKLLVCLVDKEQGDWLADEERFNDEEPLWFSENSHRISPVRKVDIIASKIQKAIENGGLDLQIVPYVIVTNGNIINAEDMFDIWDNLDIRVVRFARGNPQDLLPLAKAVKPANENMSQEDFGRFKKVLKKLG